jgi:microsomal dipeptidase-like Zn-dependent dipeptidase
MIKIISAGVVFLLLIVWWVLEFIVPAQVELSQNIITLHEPYTISPAAQALHDRILVADLHTDSLLWKRDLNKHGNRGHVDVPRLLAGNVALQMFTAVTKSPDGQNYESNTSDSDIITYLAMVQLWPVSTWFSLLERVLYQADKLEQFANESNNDLVFVKNQQDLTAVLALRAKGSSQIAALYGIEGAHSLEGKLNNVQILFDAGVRMIGITHFFDNELAGSLHGISGAGLTEFGRKVVLKAVELGMIVDIAHASPAAVEEILMLSDKPVILSHGGMQGACDTPRNLSDELMKKVAAHGGLVGIGFWDGAVCDPSPVGVVKSIRYAIDTLGVDAVALGSDYDGTVEVTFDTAELAVLTQVMLEQDFSEDEITKVMGANTVAFFSRYLPAH